MNGATAVMFHHFHGGEHAPSPGSIDAPTLDRLLASIALEKSILNAETFAEKVADGKIDSSDTCLTFDDALKCQFEIAMPVLEARGLTGYFFVYSSAFERGGAELEVFRNFRSQRYDSTDRFLDDLLDVLAEKFRAIRTTLDETFRSDYLAQYSFYSLSDRRLRFLRDEILRPDEYTSAMRVLMERQGIDPEDSRRRLMMSEDDLRCLCSRGHQVGLHSHSHPTRIDQLGSEVVRSEYERNFAFIEHSTGTKPVSMSHPCGRYSIDSLDALRDLGIIVGFIDTPAPNVESDPLRIPRDDHSDLVRALKP